MQVGLGQIHAHVLEKPEPRSGKNKVTYYNLVIGDMGWKARVACNFAVYSGVMIGTPDQSKRYTFTGNLDVVRATRSGSSFPDDFMAIELTQVKEFVQPKAVENGSAHSPATAGAR